MSPRRILQSRGRAARAAALAVPVALFLATLASCGDGRSITDPLTGVNLLDPLDTRASEARQVKDLMVKYYYWYDRMPDADIDKLDTAEQAIDALRYRPVDRYSFVEKAATFNQLFNDGKSVGIGIVYRVDGERANLHVVFSQSPAAAAGLQRGDRLLSVNGQPTDQLIRESRLADAFGATDVGVRVDLVVERAGQPLSLSATKAQYSVDTVLDARTFERPGGRRIGYINLYQFIGTTNDEWDRRLAPLVAAGARDLVVDLRENGGGLLSSAAHVAATLAPRAAQGQAFSKLTYNDKQSASNQTLAMPAAAQPDAFDRVVFITSPRSCSAAESLVNGLRPFREAATIGETTCGKPVGFNPFTVREKIVNFVTFSATNRDDGGGYYDGLAATCAITAEPLLPWGDDKDPRLAAALAWIETGQCPAAAATDAIAKDAVPGRATPRSMPDVPHPAREGLARYFGAI